SDHEPGPAVVSGPGVSGRRARTGTGIPAGTRDLRPLDGPGGDADPDQDMPAGRAPDRWLAALGSAPGRGGARPDPPGPPGAPVAPDVPSAGQELDGDRPVPAPARTMPSPAVFAPTASDSPQADRERGGLRRTDPLMVVIAATALLLLVIGFSFLGSLPGVHP